MKQIVDFIYRTATGRKHTRMLYTPVFAAFFLLLIVLVILLALKADAFFHRALPLQYPWNYVASVPLLASGGFLWGWSVLHFAKAGGTPVPVNPPVKLVNSGPYAYVRNPMLAGVFLILFAVAFFMASPSLLFVFGPAFICCSILEFKLIEEPELERRLGEQYLDYKRKTPMLFPKFFRMHGNGTTSSKTSRIKRK